MFLHCVSKFKKAFDLVWHSTVLKVYVDNLYYFSHAKPLKKSLFYLLIHHRMHISLFIKVVTSFYTTSMTCSDKINWLECTYMMQKNHQEALKTCISVFETSL